MNHAAARFAYDLAVSWSWYLYTTRSPQDVVRVDAEYQAAIDEYLSNHDVDDEYAEAGAGGSPPPRPDDVAAAIADRRENLAPAIRARLLECRATVSFDYVRGDATESPLQVSALRFWLERLEPCVFDWGDLSLELGEIALQKLARAKSRGHLGGRAPVAKPKKPVKTRTAKPGELRAIALVKELTRLANDHDARVDLSRALAKLSVDAQRYVQLIIEDGACADAAAARSLDLSPDAVDCAATEVEATLRALA
jgi:hypothetical protein